MSFESAEKSPLLLALCCTLRSLAKRWQTLAEELTQLDELLDNLTQEYAGSLRRQFGVGPQTAAILLAVAGDNPERLKNEAALASLCGVNPLPASSGKTNRHRLNHDGSREANNALWLITLVCMRSDPLTLEEQQVWFNHYRHEFNFVRSHNVHHGKTPSSQWIPSVKQWDGVVREVEYLKDAHLYKLHAKGNISAESRLLFLSESLRGEYVMMKEVDDGLHVILFDRLILAYYDSIERQILRID